MPKSNLLLDALNSGKILILDGGMGTMLQKQGMPAGISPELFCQERPDILQNIHNQYIEAGADLITTCTFGANRFKIPEANIFNLCRQKALLAGDCAKNSGRRVFILGDVGPCGHFSKPLGDIEPEDMLLAFVEQIRGLVAGGVDGIIIETQFDLAEAKLSVLAAKMCCDLPIFVSMTFEDGKSLTGSSATIFAKTMQNMQVAAVGVNCSLGPKQLIPVVQELLNACTCPVFVQPNAGLPQLKDGKTIFPLDPETFAEETALFAQMGAKLLGGCCGTTPDHIKLLAKNVANLQYNPKKDNHVTCVNITSRSRLVQLSSEMPLAIIGERINPTGKKALMQELEKGEHNLVLEFAKDQIQKRAKILDVNVAAPGVDELELLPQITQTLVSHFDFPLCLDSPNSAALTGALTYYPGSCLINSVSGEEDKMETLAPLCRDAGSPFILLPIQNQKLPETARERIRILENLLLECENLDIPKSLILVDILALAISANMDGAKACLEVLHWCKKENLATTIGLSNLSFGLPARELINSTFLSMAAATGLAACIANPSAQRIQEVVDTTNLLRNFDPHAEHFLANYAKWTNNNSNNSGNSGSNSSNSNNNEKKDSKDTDQETNKEQNKIREAVIAGDSEHIVELLESELAKGVEVIGLLNEQMIPGINAVGDLFARKEYFLPQLIRSAETMQKGFAHLQPLLEKDQKDVKKDCFVLATVEGDIHDIGKNIVAMLLRNHGFEVLDLGKDVKAKTIVEAAVAHKAKFIGLSALMTTTMTKMQETIKLLKNANLNIPVLVGGAAVTAGFAAEIGAIYCQDAVDTVKVAKELLAQG